MVLMWRRSTCALPIATNSPAFGLPDNHLNWCFWAQGDRCFWFDGLAWNYFKSPAAQNFGQHNPKLHPGKALANAGPWPTAKRKESILRQGTLIVRHPAIWIKLDRIRKIPVGAM